MSETRQLIVCCDGTNNNVTGGRTDTNVIKLQEALQRDAHQIVFYDPGVGNSGSLPGATVVDRVRLKLDRIAGLAFGSGVYENIAECYIFLMNNYQKGDEIYLFGFSRGAFTARALSGVVNMFGLLRPELANLVPTLLHHYFSKRETEGQKADVSREADEIRRLFVEPDLREVWIHFIGVWDTVASIGLPPFDKQITGSPTVRDKKFKHVRQALALDEYRTPFLPRLYAEPDFDAPPTDSKPEQSLVQQWFHGVHCDVGGGYDPYDSDPQCGCGLSDTTLKWLFDHARGKGLRAKDLKLPDTITRVHSELYNEALWALAGMVQRDLKPELGNSGTIDLIRPISAMPGHSSALMFPQDTVWAIARPWKPIIIALAVLLVAMFVMATLMLPRERAGLIDASSVGAWLSSVWVYLQNLFSAEGLWSVARALWMFICWQATLQWSFVDHLAEAIPQLKTALLFRLLAQGTGLFIIARMTSWAFAQVAGLRERQLPPSDALNALGIAPRWLTVFTLGTTLSGLLSLLIAPWVWGWLASLLRVLMNLTWWLQAPAMLGVLALVGWGVWARARR